jgi:indolepyruvate decarboxylase
VLDDLGTAPREIARVLRSCRERSLPVYLEIPRDMPMADCASVLAAASWPTDPEVAAACADEILQLLSAARSPALMVGVEVRRYGLEAKVAELARRLGLPVVTSFMGRGLLTEAGVPVLGTYLGRAGRREVTDLVEGSDGLLLLGVIVSDTNFGVSARKIDMRRTIHAFDRQVRLRHHVYPNLPLSALVEALLTRCAGREATGPARSDASYPGGLIADEAPIRPADIAAAVNDAMAEHGRLPIACDVGDCLFTAMEIAHTHLVAPGYYAGMGFGVPAGLGLQATTGQRPLILVGDGAFAMTGWELGVCRRHGWDPIVIVFNNRGWEMLRAFEPGARFNDLEDWHFADIAKSLGGEGRRVATRSELQSALAHALAARGRFQLVEAMLARGAISDTLTRFVAALGAARGADMKGSGT